MAAMSLKEFKTLKRRDFENGAVIDELHDTVKEREQLLSVVCEIIDVHDNNEWGDVTGSYPLPTRPLGAGECGELGAVIDKCRALVGTTKNPEYDQRCS